MNEKTFSTLELSLLRSYSSKLRFDDHRPLGFVSVKDEANICQADADSLACTHDPQSIQVFLAVITVARR